VELSISKIGVQRIGLIQSRRGQIGWQEFYWPSLHFSVFLFKEYRGEEPLHTAESVNFSKMQFERKLSPSSVPTLHAEYAIYVYVESFSFKLVHEQEFNIGSFSVPSGWKELRARVGKI